MNFRTSCRNGALSFTSVILLLAVVGTVRAAPEWDDVLKQPSAWYGMSEAAAVADTVLVYQLPAGGWPKNHDMTKPPGPESFERRDEAIPTLDNGATHTQIEFLARVQAAQPQDRFAQAIERGVAYLLEAQYDNGGWPQFYPLRKGYYSHITFNDDAMIGALEVLRAVANRRPGFDGLDADHVQRATRAVQLGVDCILRCQVVQDGALTAWCAQHDAMTLAPVAARAYEHASLSGMETVGIVRFLMRIERPPPEVAASIRAAVAWLERVRISGIRVIETPEDDLPRGCDVRVVDDPAAPALWARFYELGTNRPIFSGRDGVVRYTLAEVEPERRSGYLWYVRNPQRLLERDFSKWEARLAREGEAPKVSGTEAGAVGRSP